MSVYTPTKHHTDPFDSKRENEDKQSLLTKQKLSGWNN